MKNLLLLLLLPAFSIAQNAANKSGTTQQFSISGNVAGLPDSTMVFLAHPGNSDVLAVDYAKNGRFKLFGTIETPDIYHLSFIGFPEVREVFLSNNKLTAAGTAKGIKNIVFTGEGVQKDYELYLARFEPFKNKLNKLVGTINKTAPGASRDSMIASLQKSQLATLRQVDLFVAQKPSSPVSAFVIYITSPLNNDPANLEKIYDKLSATGKNTLYGREVEKMVSASKIGMVGTIAPDFAQPDSGNVPISLSSFKGKYVLVDFWASWCGPCRMENPAVVNAYKAFKDKNFTIFGVSLDQNRDKWLQAIQADNLTWTHASDLKYWQNAAAQLYHISGIPANMLIDPSGKIIARNLRGEQLYGTLQQLLK